MALSDDSVVLIDWLNLSIRLKSHGRQFGPTVARTLLSVARRESDEVSATLARAHFVAESFSDDVVRVIEHDLIAQHHKSRTAKEQADLLLAVLAMDHLHSVQGTPKLFIIATGDQDFVPLVERLLAEKAQVVLVAGSLLDLAPEYRAIVAQQNVKLIGLMESENIPELRGSKDADERAFAVLALLFAVFSGGILGGDQKRNLGAMRTLSSTSGEAIDEERLESWIREFSSSEMRRVAVPATRSHGNRAITSRRTYLDFAKNDVSSILLDADWVLRRTDPTRPGVTRGSLGVGRFAHDDGSRVSAAVSALIHLGWLQERPDGTLDNSFPWGSDGFIEPLYKLIAITQAECYKTSTQGLDRDKLWSGLASTAQGALPSRKGGKEAAELIDFGRRLGVIDALPSAPDRFILGVVPNHGLVKRLTQSLRLLKGVSGFDGWMAEHEVLTAIAFAEQGSDDPICGFDTKDRRMLMRALSRADLLRRRDVDGEFQVRLRQTDWVHRI